MQYYTFELTDRPKDLCVVITPFGKFQYNKAPMGVKQYPDFGQEIIEDIFHDIKEVYIEDIGIFGNSQEHMFTIQDDVLHHLEEKGFTVNPFKCEWMVRETNWLGHWLTPKGLKSCIYNLHPM
jgi:hypothetical protein